MIPVRQSTAFEFSIGPVLDADGVAFTGAVVGDFQIKKNGADWAALNGSATATHTAVGNYDIVLTTSDLDTVGVAAIRISDTVNACATVYLQVIEEAVYDALFAASATGLLPANTTQIGGQAVSLSSDNRLRVDVAEWNDIPLATTNPLPNAAADAAGGLPISDAGGLDLDTLLARLDAAITTRMASYTQPTGFLAATFPSTLASSAEVTGLNVNTRANVVVPVEIETPDASTQVYKIRLFLFDVTGNMEAPDSTPTIALVNAAGTDRSSRLSAASNPSTGVYSWDYTATAGDAEEQLNWTFTVVEGGLTRVYPAVSYVVEETAYRFTSTDRATLNAAATAQALATAQADLDILTGTDGATLATLQPNYAPLRPSVPGRTLDVDDQGQVTLGDIVQNTNISQAMTNFLEVYQEEFLSAWANTRWAVDPTGVRAAVGLASANLDTQLGNLLDALAPDRGTIGSTGNTTTTLHLDGKAWGNDGPNERLLMFKDVSTGLYYPVWITDWVAATDVATITPALPVTPENAVDTYWVTGIRRDVSAPTAADNATAVLAAGDVDGFTLEEAMKVILANASGKLSGAATATNVIRAADDSKARITATVDADGNRTAVTIDATG